MRKSLLIVLVLLSAQYPLQGRTFEWAVIGAGPGGIAATGQLIENNVSSKKILWIDEAFNVGRIGQYYGNVPSNTRIKNFLQFFNSCKSFTKKTKHSMRWLNNHNPEEWCALKHAARPSLVITNNLRKKVIAKKARVLAMERKNGIWELSLSSKQKHYAHNVILATGSHPKSLNLTGPQEIPLDLALDPNKLKALVNTHDSVAIFGSSHSAMLIMRALSTMNIKRIINFYRSPLIYSQRMDGWTLYAYSGLKAETGMWAKEVLEKNPPTNLTRVLSNDQNISELLPLCSKVIYAIGYEQNDVSFVKGVDARSYDKTTGVIADNLFGIGIAYPECYTDPASNVECRVGYKSFMKFAKKQMPFWLKKAGCHK